MTTETFPLPSSYAYGKVVGRIIYTIADTAEDVDDKPQARAAAGKLRFEPTSAGAKVVDADYTAIVMNSVVTANLSSTGRILDAEGRQGIWLVEGVYKVTFEAATTSDGRRGSLPSFLIEVTADHTDADPLDLAAAVPPSVPAGATVQTLIVPANGADGQILVRSGVGLAWADPEDVGGGGSVSPEEAVAAVASSLVEGDGVTITYDDGAGTISITADTPSPGVASTTSQGVVELATIAEANSDDETLAVTPAGLKAVSATRMLQADGVTARFRGFVTAQPADLAAGDWWILIEAV